MKRISNVFNEFFIETNPQALRTYGFTGEAFSGGLLNVFRPKKHGRIFKLTSAADGQEGLSKCQKTPMSNPYLQVALEITVEGSRSTVSLNPTSTLAAKELLK